MDDYWSEDIDAVTVAFDFVFCLRIWVEQAYFGSIDDKLLNIVTAQSYSEIYDGL